MLDTLVSELDLQISVEHELSDRFTQNTEPRCEMSFWRELRQGDGIILGPMSTMDYPSVSEGAKRFRALVSLISTQM